MATKRANLVVHTHRLKKKLNLRLQTVVYATLVFSFMDRASAKNVASFFRIAMNANSALT